MFEVGKTYMFEITPKLTRVFKVKSIVYDITEVYSIQFIHPYETQSRSMRGVFLESRNAREVVDTFTMNVKSTLDNHIAELGNVIVKI
jgi:hypothetical protein